MKLRVSAVQYHLHTITSFDQFADRVEHYVKTAAEFGSNFVLFPEFMTTQLLSIGAQPITELPKYTEGYRQLFSNLAKAFDMHIIGGTHVIREGDHLYNAAHLFYPDGQIGVQKKLHVTPTERDEWKMWEGDGLEVFDTAFGRIAMLTCYDIEFPEIVRMARARGADVIFCPSCTDDKHGFYRVRYTCHARTIENQVYVAVTGTVGSLPNVDLMRLNYGQAALIAPNDIPFPPAGIIVEGDSNQDMIVTGDFDLDLLHEVRKKGSVMTWRDRRTDLYTDWE
jgi:predicted amidohydrolase